MDVNQFIGENLNKLANMSVHKLKVLLKKVIARRNPNDAHTIQVIRAFIKKKKKEYPIIANQLLARKAARNINSPTAQGK